jgi:hypothetical protein
MTEKEKILNKYHKKVGYNEMDSSDILKCMEEYAKEIAEKACKEQREICYQQWKANHSEPEILHAPLPNLDKLIENT